MLRFVMRTQSFAFKSGFVKRSVLCARNLSSPTSDLGTEITVEGVQGASHEFSQTRAEDMLERAVEDLKQTPQEKKDGVCQGVQGRLTEQEVQAAEDLNAYNHTSNVSLHGVMQSTVPEPYSQSPSHMNMPMGGANARQKYVAGEIKDTHPSRQFSTHAWNANIHSMTKAVQFEQSASPQGIQGFSCDNFNLWYENCQRFRFQDCYNQLLDMQEGRKSLADVLKEQDRLIQQVAKDFKERNELEQEGNMQGLQGDIGSPAVPTTPALHASYQGSQQKFSSYSVEEFGNLEAPCPQGVQGAECAHFNVWLQNCVKYGFTDCKDQLQDFSSGRKTLQDIFKAQDDLILEVVQQYEAREKEQKVAHSIITEAARYNSVGTLSSVRPYCTNASSKDPEENLSQTDKLKRAVKEYGGTVIVFHVGISLISLGGFYVAVSSGIDVVGMLGRIGVGESILSSRLAQGASTFVVAYAVHKVFAPVRIAITLTCTPFIVRRLRSIGVLKPPKVKS